MAKQSGKTKDALVAENTTLRDQLKAKTKELKEMLTKSTSDIDLDSAEMAVGLYKKDGVYMMVKIAYDPETEVAKVISNEAASRVPEASYLAKMNTQEYLIEKIFTKLDLEV